MDHQHLLNQLTIRIKRSKHKEGLLSVEVDPEQRFSWQPWAIEKLNKVMTDYQLKVSLLDKRVAEGGKLEGNELQEIVDGLQAALKKAVLYIMEKNGATPTFLLSVPGKTMKDATDSYIKNEESLEKRKALASEVRSFLETYMSFRGSDRYYCLTYFEPERWYKMQGRGFVGKAIAVIDYANTPLQGIMNGDAPGLRNFWLEWLGRNYSYLIAGDTAILIIEKLDGERN